MAYKFKYLVFRKKPYSTGKTVARVDVRHLNKRGIYAKWDELEQTFPKSEYQSSLTEMNHEMPCYIQKPQTTEA
jgi:hypothetical protein